MNTQIVVMAAGMGSRFGGLKQLEPFGKNGETLLDFSLYDAKEAGFDSAVIIIKKEIENEFRDVCGKRLEKLMNVEYAFQEKDMLPIGFDVPKDRIKPWGTGHAIICAEKKITSPFAVINADDYYGKEAYKLIHKQLIKSDDMCMVGYKLRNTLTENGTVCRGVCEAKNGFLKAITEHTDLDINTPLSPDTIVSMNLWGLTPDIIPLLKKEFVKFLENNIDNPKAEFYLPSAINNIMNSENKPVRVLETNEQWYGITYKEDTDFVKQAINNFIKDGKYNKF